MMLFAAKEKSHVCENPQLAENSCPGFTTNSHTLHQENRGENPPLKEGFSGLSITFSTGRENDGTGLYYLRARYYSPTLQRFISEDPIGLRGGLNQYAYVRNSATNIADPGGKCPWCVFGAVAGAGFDLGSQLVLNGGDFHQVNWVSVGGSALSGALGGGLGQAITGSLMRKVLFNALGSADIQGIIRMGENLLCGNDLSKNVLRDVAFGGVLGAVGTRVGEGVNNVLSEIAWDSATLAQKLNAISNGITNVNNVPGLLGAANAVATVIGNAPWP